MTTQNKLSESGSGDTVAVRIHEMVERVARELASVDCSFRGTRCAYDYCRFASKASCVEHWWPEQIEAAGAVIEAMRTPTRDMIIAGCSPPGNAPYAPSRAWRHMIAAILGTESRNARSIPNTAAE